MSYAAEIRPVHVADLLSREGHPLAARVIAARETRRVAEPKELDAGLAARRTLGVAAGAMLVVGTVVAGAFGLTHGPTSAPGAAGEPVGAAPGKGAPAMPNEAPVAQAVTPQFTNTAAEQSLPQTPGAPAGQIGVPAKVPPPAAAKPAPARPAPPQAPRSAAPAAPAATAPSAPSSGPVQTLTAPVTNAVGGSTLSNAVAPVTSTVDHTLDHTLQPALSLIGGLLSI